jgi:hypothetical protein
VKTKTPNTGFAVARDVIALNRVATSIVEGMRGLHPTHVFVRVSPKGSPASEGLGKFESVLQFSSDWQGTRQHGLSRRKTGSMQKAPAIFCGSAPSAALRGYFAHTFL